MVDDNAFYREITRRIFSNLHIEKALLASMKYLRTVIPGDLLILQYSNLEAGTHQIVATATAEEGKRWNATIPFTPTARKMAAERVVAVEKTKYRVVLSNHPERDEDLRIVRDFFQLGDSSLLVMALSLGSRLVGSLAMFADGHGRYAEDHARLFSLLREPFAMVLVSTHMYQENVKLTEMLRDDNRFLHRELQRKSGDTIVGEEYGLKNVMEMVRQVSTRDSPVLLLGETGTGKDLVAQAVHRLSARRSGPFITVNCGAIPDTLLDSELFGHEKGAFTGALSQKRGRFERSDGGTIFLDEIGELPPQAQVRLLRVLQNKEVERVGGSASIRVDIRVVAATNRDLEAMVKENRFREDLWFRLNVFPIKIPPLRERKVDIPALVDYFVEQKAQEMQLRPMPRLAEKALERLEAYRWPGNVRELENVVERALIVCRNGHLTFPELDPAPAPQPSTETPAGNDYLPTFDETVSDYLQRVLATAKGKVHGPGGAADLAGLNPSTLRHKMRKLGIRSR